MKQLEIDEIPQSAKALPKLAQQMWLRVFNRTIKTQSKRKATETSWAILRQFYKKGTKGNWFKIK